MSGVRYTEELLEQAVTCCDTWDEVLAFLEVKPYAKVERYLLKRCARFGIDASHITRRRQVPPPERATALEAALAARLSLSIAGSLRLLGMPDTAASRRRFRSLVTEAGADTDHFLGQAHARGKVRPGQRRTPDSVLVRRTDGRRTRTVLLRRALLETGRPQACAGCGTGPVWHGRPLTLEIDHINGDWCDDRAENLRLLCPNCHAVTDSWCRGGRRGPRSRRAGVTR